MITPWSTPVRPAPRAALLAALLLPISGAHPVRSTGPGPVVDRTTGAADTVAAHPAPVPRLGRLQPVLGAFHLTMLRRAPGASSFGPFGDVRVVRDTARIDGLAVVRNIVSYDWGNGRRTLDTTLSVVGSLAPVSERTRTPSRMVDYDMAGLHATGRIGPADSLRPIDDSLSALAFNSTDLDLLLTALRLHRHFEVQLPLYDPEYPGYRLATARVSGMERLRTPAGVRRAWRVTVTEGTRPPLRYLIDAGSRRMWRKEMQLPDGTAFQIRDLGSGAP